MSIHSPHLMLVPRDIALTHRKPGHISATNTYRSRYSFECWPMLRSPLPGKLPNHSYPVSAMALKDHIHLDSSSSFIFLATIFIFANCNQNPVPWPRLDAYSCPTFLKTELKLLTMEILCNPPLPGLSPDSLFPSTVQYFACSLYLQFFKQANVFLTLSRLGWRLECSCVCDHFPA